MISFLFLSPQIQDGDHYVNVPTPHHVGKTFFSEPWNLEYIFITIFFNRMCLSTQNPAWLPYWLALLAQVPRLSDVQLLFHIGI